MSGKHTERTSITHIVIDDHEYGTVTPIRVTKKGKFIAGLAVAGALTTLGVAEAGGQNPDAPTTSVVQPTVEKAKLGSGEPSEPAYITYTVGKHDTADGIGDKFTDSYSELKAVAKDVEAVEPNAPVLHAGDELHISTEHMDPATVEAYEQDNSARH